MNTGRNSKQPASAGTLGEKGRCRPSAQVLTPQIIGAIKLPPNQKGKETGKKRLKGHGPKHVYNTLGYNRIEEYISKIGGEQPTFNLNWLCYKPF